MKDSETNFLSFLSPSSLGSWILICHTPGICAHLLEEKLCATGVKPWIKAGGRTKHLPAAVQGSHLTQHVGLSRQLLRVQLHSVDFLKNENYACSLEFLSSFPGTFSPHMQTHLSEKLQGNSYLLRKLWQAFLIHMLESLRKPMRRRVKKQITADSMVLTSNKETGIQSRY